MNKNYDFGDVDSDSSKGLWLKDENFGCFSWAGLVLFWEKVKFSSLPTAKTSQKGIVCLWSMLRIY